MTHYIHVDMFKTPEEKKELEELRSRIPQNMYNVITMKLQGSWKPSKKYVMIFKIRDGNKIRTKSVHFGSSAHEDYTIHQDDRRKRSYINRHKKNENWNNPFTPGALSRWLLWNKKTLDESLDYYLKKFDLEGAYHNNYLFD